MAFSGEGRSQQGSAAQVCSTAEMKVNRPEEVSILHLLGCVPSPVRNTAHGVPSSASLSHLSRRQGAPCSPPPHSPTILATPALPPPPPFTTAMDSGAGPSYRERLRAGGQGAFQRAFNVGLMPKAMKQEWNAAHPAANDQSAYSQTADPHNTMYMSCMESGDTQQNWSGGGYDYWYVPVEQQQLPMDQAQTLPMDQSQMMAMQQPQMPMYQQQQMVSDCAYVSQCAYGQQPPYVPQQPLAHAPQLPPVPPMPTPAMCHDSTPTDISRCMAIIMPQAAQFTSDRDLAAQLEAVAYCQQYED